MCTLYRFGDTLKLLGLGRLDTRRLVLIFGFPANARTIKQLDELIGFGVYRKFHTGSSFTRILHKLSDNRQLVADLKGTIFSLSKDSRILRKFCQFIGRKTGKTNKTNHCEKVPFDELFIRRSIFTNLSF